MSALVCSVCGSPAGIDTRMGSTNHYLACACGADEVWIADRCGGYSIPRNGAELIPFETYLARKRRKE